MNTPQIFKFLLISWFLFKSLPAAAAEAPVEYYAPQNVRRFADFLYAQGDYLRAADEYQRYLFFLADSSSDKTEIQYRIARCYRFAGQGEQAIERFQTLLGTHPTDPFANRAYYEIGATYFLMDQFEQSARFLRDTLPRIMNLRQQGEAQQLIGLSYLMQKEWSEAGEVFKRLAESDDPTIKEQASTYHTYAEKGAQLATRSPLLAGILSALVPGAGRFYTGRSGDALTSLFIVGLAGWQTYDGFRRDGISSAKGWTFGILGGVFYVGNIYGSVISARVHNRHITDEFLATLSIELPY